MRAGEGDNTYELRLREVKCDDISFTLEDMAIKTTSINTANIPLKSLTLPPSSTTMVIDEECVDSSQ